MDMTIQLPPKDSTEVHHFSENVTLEWANAGEIAIVTITSPTREDIDACYNLVTSLYDALPEGAALNLVFDVSKMSMTPYGRKKATDLFRYRKEIYARTAVILPNTVLAHAIRLFVRLEAGRFSSRARELFMEREKAIAWIERKIAEGR